jgi:CrcB protein
LWLALAAAGAAGTCCRYALSLLMRRVAPSWPAATLVVNVLGCLVLALIAALALRAGRLSEEARVALSVGFCGGLTTYSSFNQELLGLWQEHRVGPAAGYFVATVALCAAAGALGTLLGRSVP